MRCKDIEHLMIEGKDRTLNRQELEAIEQHLSRCSSCAQYQGALDKIESGIKTFVCPNPPQELVDKTRSACYAEIEALKVSGDRVFQRIRSKSVPKLIWTAVFALVVLTGILIISLLPGFEIEETLSLKTVLIFTLIVQNAAMLFFAPVLIQKFRLPRNGLDINGYENIIP